MPPSKVYRFLLLILFCVSCGGSPSDGLSDATGVPTPTSTITSPIATSDEELQMPTFPTPALTLSEDPLSGGVPAVPSVLIVAARQSKVTLATFLKTTAEQLDWVNPGLPDPIPAGALVVIPPVYHVDDETLSGVSEKTGLPLDTLLSYNPDYHADTALPKGELLKVPPLYIVPEETFVAVAAEALGTDSEALLSANPELTDESTIAVGTPLVVPVQNEEK